MIAFQFFISGMALFTIAIQISNFRLFMKREKAEIFKLFGGADLIYAPAKKMEVNPSLRSSYAWAPLSDCILKA
jgi:hypothetical protein